MKEGDLNESMGTAFQILLMILISAASIITYDKFFSEDSRSGQKIMTYSNADFIYWEYGDERDDLSVTEKAEIASDYIEEAERRGYIILNPNATMTQPGWSKLNPDTFDLEYERKTK